MLKFDLFDAINRLRKIYGDASEISVFCNDDGYVVRLTVWHDNDIVRHQFVVSYVEAHNDIYATAMNEKFKCSLNSIGRYLGDL